MRCKNCGKRVMLDSENDLIHIHLIDKGTEPRLCEPSNPDSKVAELIWLMNKTNKDNM